MTITVNVNQVLIHEVYLDKLNSGYINNSIYPALDDLYRLIKKVLEQDGLPRTPKQVEVINKLVAEIVSENSPWIGYTQDLQEAALYEMRYLAKQAELTGLSNRALLSYIGEQMMVLASGTSQRAGYWREYVAASNKAITDNINNIVKTGYARNQTISQVLRDIRQQFTGATQKDAVSLARTAFAHYTQQARRALVSTNEDYYKEAIFVAVWDNRTTLTCRSFAQQRFKANDPKLPIPPLHYGCRSTLVYGPKGFQLTGQRAAISGKDGKAAQVAYQKRAESVDGKVIRRGKRDDKIFNPETLSSDSSHEAWLRQQPMWFIESALGKSRAALFKRGGLSLKRFVDMSGKQLTLAELEKLDKQVFIKLGLATRG